MKRHWLLGLLMVVALVLGACAPAATPAPTEAPAAPAQPTEAPAAAEPTSAEPEMPFAGETVTVFTPAGDEQARVFKENFAAFEARTGITVNVEITGNFEELTRVECDAGNPHDIYNFPQPGLMADIARTGCLTDLSSFIPASDMQAQYAQSWIDMLTVDGAIYGLWHGVDVKSLVWYAKPAFDAAGYQIPETWDDLLALSDQIVADGGTPWCIGVESGGATGWPGTDWVEDVMLRTAGAAKYDQWTSGALKFDSPEVRNAFETVGNIWFNPDYVVGGTTGILTTNFGDSPLGLFDGTCFLHRQASFIPNFFPEGTVMGEDVDYFYLPPIDAAMGKPVLVSGNLVSLGKDTPAGREVMKFMMSAESVEAEVKAGNAIGPMTGVSLDWYPTDMQRGFAEILMNADTFRFDGSDLMPGVVGAGSFWTGAVDWVGGKSLDEVLPAIDATWPQ